MLLTKDLSLSSRRASQAANTATHNCWCVVGGLTMSRICIAIWSQRCAIRFISWLLSGQSMTSTSCFSRKDIVVRAWCGETLSWTDTKPLRKVRLIQSKKFIWESVGKLSGSWALNNYQLTQVPKVKGVPYYEGWRHIAICLLHTSINTSLPLLQEGYPKVKSRRLMVRAEMRCPIRRSNSTLNLKFEWNRL